MSSNYSANQYESSFRPNRHNNWCETRDKQRPQAKTGHTAIIADDRGHLLPGLGKRGSAWPDFKGTWDLPSRIPACHINPTGRSAEGLYRLRCWGLDPQHKATYQPYSCSEKSERLQAVSEQSFRDTQQDGVASASTADGRPPSQSSPVAGGESTADQNQDSQEAAVVRPDEDQGSARAPASERPMSQCSLAEEGTIGQPHSWRPGSNE